MVDSTKIEVMIQWEVLKTPSAIRSFLGIVVYYRRFIHDFPRL